ncbi:MAG: ABC transporter ATP-binding protein [Muribaculaceae bacterium]|nr:ABC transporter ATP-binding protein [Muribaculaceae bacterium]
MLQLRDIYKSYGPVRVLNGISLDFKEGEIMSIVGPSGAGKTTLLQIAGTLDRPDSGEVIFNGEDLLRLKDRKLSKFRNLQLGFIFQFHQLLPEFSALENVALPALISGEKRKRAFERARRWLEELGLGHRLNHKPSELSGGEKQRTAIARALINEPALVLADEPTGSLDSKNRDEIKTIITDLREKYRQSFVIVTHDREIADIADRKVLIEDGIIVTQNGEAIKGEEKAPMEEKEKETIDEKESTEEKEKKRVEDKESVVGIETKVEGIETKEEA